MKEATVATPSTKTDDYKVHLQKIVYQELGIKVSKDKAWSLFKAIIHGTVEHIIHIQDKKLSLSGVGTFQVLETKPRGSKAGLDENGKAVEGAEVWPCVPRFRFYPSSVIDNLVEKSYGLGNHEDLEEKHYGIYRPEEAEQGAEDKKAAKKEILVEETPVATPVEETPVPEKVVDEFDDLEDL